MKQKSQGLPLDRANCPGSLAETTFSLKFEMVAEITFMPYMQSNGLWVMLSWFLKYTVEDTRMSNKILSNKESGNRI